MLEYILLNCDQAAGSPICYFLFFFIFILFNSNSHSLKLTVYHAFCFTFLILAVCKLLCYIGISFFLFFLFISIKYVHVNESQVTREKLYISNSITFVWGFNLVLEFSLQLEVRASRLCVNSTPLYEH